MTLIPAGHAAWLRVFIDRHTGRRRIQLRRSRGWIKSVGAVVVPWPHSKFANPYPSQTNGRPSITVTVDGQSVTVYNRAQPVELFRAYLRRHPELVDAARALAGRDLTCWCKPHEECHAHELLRIAAGGKP